MKRISLPSITRAVICVGFFLVLGWPGAARSQLTPEEILVLVNGESSDSLRVGRLYMELRKVPAENLARVSVPDRDQISRKQYDTLIAAPLRRAIDGLHDHGKAIRCIVTIYGIPLRISAVTPPDTSKQEVKAVREALEKKEEELSSVQQGGAKGKDSRDPSHLEPGRLRAEIRALRQRLGELRGRDTVAAVDSELALLYWPSYSLAGQQPNPHFTVGPAAQRPKERVLMVSRIDAPRPELAEKLIRTAVEVEATGLAGKIYLDARGLAAGKDAYGAFDEKIRETARILHKGLLPVVLDDRPELFGPGSAPDAALYCGWYSLAEYKDAFAWSKGAVGYHVASAEGRSLRDPEKKYWVKEMLERGVIATLGPVAEPYLNAYPLPSLFLPLLMSGRYTLAEVFALTNPFLSWQMMLIGDPLYTPFRRKPAYLLLNGPTPPS